MDYGHVAVGEDVLSMSSYGGDEDESVRIIEREVVEEIEVLGDDTFDCCSSSSSRSSHHSDTDQPGHASSEELGMLGRLFDSELFTINMALVYLTRNPEHHVQRYLCCNTLMKFPSDQLEFYAPQLLSIYCQHPKQYPFLRNFLVSYSSSHVQFAVLISWLLMAEMSSINVGTKQHLVMRMLFDNIRRSSVPPEWVQHHTSPVRPRPVESLALSQSTPASPTRPTHRRVHSEVVSPSRGWPSLGEGGAMATGRASLAGTTSVGGLSMHQHDLTFPMRMDAGRALHRSSSTSWASDVLAHDTSSASSADSAHSPPPMAEPTLLDFMMPQCAFLEALMTIGERLRRFASRDARRTQLYAELSMLNLSLPARVYVPLRVSTLGQGPVKEHHVVRIAPTEAVVLNSKDRAPYMIQVEVVECDDFVTSDVPQKMNPKKTGSRHERSHSDGSVGGEGEEGVSASAIRKRLKQASSDPHYQFSKSSSDPSAVKAKEPWAKKAERIRRLSPYGHLPRWRLIPVIVKAGDDMRQEMLASQLLSLFQHCWQTEKVPLWLRPIRIMVTSAQGGLVEVIDSAVSLHQTKKRPGDSLLDYFISHYGEQSSQGFLSAQKNFVESLAAYSLFCYFAQVKDRHNGNILLDNEGHIIHIDFGFFLSNSPGGNMGFETAPFKLSPDFVDVMGGTDHDMFKYFKLLILRGFVAARKHMDDFVNVVKIMQQGSDLPCFFRGEEAVKSFEARFSRSMTDDELQRHVEKLIRQSLGNRRTRLYDNFQYYTNGIL